MLSTHVYKMKDLTRTCSSLLGEAGGEETSFFAGLDGFSGDLVRPFPFESDSSLPFTSLAAFSGDF